MRLHDVAFDIGVTIDHPTYDTLYLAFAIAVGAAAVVSSDATFLRSIRTHPDEAVSGMGLSLKGWARTRGL